MNCVVKQIKGKEDKPPNKGQIRGHPLYRGHKPVCPLFKSPLKASSESGQTLGEFHSYLSGYTLCMVHYAETMVTPQLAVGAGPNIRPHKTESLFPFL